ncbi:hypothetical protein KFU94_44580 [Chloroflexi bacterium TSY]|nr:hypothetical protein [Chloroflexi bacterium TSY]
MNRLDAILQRLPPIYNVEPGSLLHQFMGLFANSLAAYDEDMNRVQRAHWIDTAFDRVDLEKLGALFDIPAAAWEPNHLYRTRLKATIAARLRGAVSRDVLEFVLVQIIDGAQQALATRYFELPTGVNRGRSVFHTGVAEEPLEPAFVEFPKQRRRSPELIKANGLLRSLNKFTLTNRGLFPVALQGVIRGVTGRLTTVPVLVNLTNGQVLTYVGDLPCGHELHLGLDDAGEIMARVGDDDVTDRVYTGQGFVPGESFTPVVPDPEPQPLMLERGDNQLWYFPLALFDEKILNAGVYGMPALQLEHGRFGQRDQAESGTLFDQSLFEQPPGVSLDLWWDEDSVASFRFEIPTGVIRRDAARSSDLDVDQSRLFALLQQTIDLLRAAAVDGCVVPRPLQEAQPLEDRVRVLDPTHIRDEMRIESRLSGLSALFDDSAKDGSRFG